MDVSRVYFPKGPTCQALVLSGRTESSAIGIGFGFVNDNPDDFSLNG
jgi:hypothetical protein